MCVYVLFSLFCVKKFILFIAMLTCTNKCRQEIIIEELHKIGNECKWQYVNFDYKPGKTICFISAFFHICINIFYE